MAHYRLEMIAELARQMAFASHELRLAQVNAAEQLLHDVDPLKGYPPEFVVFRITGYHPRGGPGDLLTGIALQHDLGLLIEQVSESLSVRTSEIAEPVLSIDDVTEKFNVTSKTIQRWRRKGLPARRFIFGDGKKRVGFLLGSVERFFSVHRDQVARGSSFSQVNDAERDEIVRRARRLATACQCCTREIARRVAKRMRRSPLTILHTIRKYDQEHPETAIFPLAPTAINEADRERLLKAYHRGVSIGALARRICRPSTAVYRVVLEERAARLARRKVRFIDDPLYHGPDAEQAIDAIVESANAELPATHATQELTADVSRLPRDLPPYLQSLYRTPLLTPAQERALFLKFNFRKYQFIAARRKLDPQFAYRRDLDELEQRLAQATEVKNQILQANLRLVVSIARKHLRNGLSLMELVSEGNITLMRAVEGFDVHKGFRFSTYATLALMKGFARSAPAMQSASRRLGRSAEADKALHQTPDPRHVHVADRLAAQDHVRHLLAGLDERERTVVLQSYGLGGSVDKSYEQLAEQMGLSKQRIRQIESAAIHKLRALAARNHE